MINSYLSALKIAYLARQSSKNRFSISEAKLKQLAQKEVLTISFLSELKRSLEELGYFLGSLKKGRYCLLAIDSLEGAPSLPLKDDTMKQLTTLSEDELEKLCMTSVMIEPITDNEQDEGMLLVNELWLILIKTASNKTTISYGELAEAISESTGYKLHHKKAMVLLESITLFCTEEKLPPLTYLATNAKSNLPKALEKTQNSKSDLEAAKTQIYDFDWSEQKKSFDLFLNKNKEI